MSHCVKKLTPRINDVREYQCAFSKDRVVVNQIFALRDIQAESSEYQVDIQLFVDFKQVYGRVLKQALFIELAELRVSEKLVRLER